MEYLAWHAVQAAARTEDSEGASHILKRKGTEVSLARPLRPAAPSPPVPGNSGAPREGEAAADAPQREEPPLLDAGPGDGGAAHQESIRAGLAAAPLWAPAGAGSLDPLAPAPPRDLGAPADPAAALPVRDS